MITEYRTSEAAKLTGATLRQLQWWDEIGLVPAVHDGHARKYLDRDLALIADIVELRNAGVGTNKVLAVREYLRQNRIDITKACGLIRTLGGPNSAGNYIYQRIRKQREALANSK